MLTSPERPMPALVVGPPPPAWRVRLCLLLLAMSLSLPLSGCSFAHVHAPGGAEDCTMSYAAPWLDAGAAAGMGLSIESALLLAGGCFGNTCQASVSPLLLPPELLVAGTVVAGVSSIYGFAAVRACRSRESVGNSAHSSIRPRYSPDASIGNGNEGVWAPSRKSGPASSYSVRRARQGAWRAP